MFTTPPATLLITGLFTGPSTGRNSGRSRGRHAAALALTAGNYPDATCQPVKAHWLRVYAPGETQALYVSHAFDACASASTPLLTVMPVRSGQGVQGTTP
jgi:hypothetical protein